VSKQKFLGQHTLAMYYQQYNKNIDKQVRQLKLFSAACLGAALLIVTTLGSYYWDLYHRADEYDAAFIKADEASAAAAELAGTDYTLGVGVKNYDMCHQFEGSKLDFDSHWKLAFQFNAIIYAMFSGLIVCSFAGLIYSQLFQLVLSCMQVTQVAHFVGVILTGVFRFNSSGKTCSAATAQYAVARADMGDLVHTWAEDGDLLRQLFICQCVLFVPFCLCTCMGMFRGKTAGEMAKERGLAAEADDDYLRTYA